MRTGELIAFAVGVDPWSRNWIQSRHWSRLIATDRPTTAMAVTSPTTRARHWRVSVNHTSPTPPPAIFVSPRKTHGGPLLTPSTSAAAMRA